MLKVTDVHGNISTCTALITVQDNISSIAVARDITVQLDASGSVTVTAHEVDGGSMDNCPIASLRLSQETFTCEHIGDNEVTLTVTDAGGNVSVDTATITVLDHDNPAICDTDMDGMPNWWEEDHFDDPTATDPEDDLDQDGSSNLHEYLAGTLPTDSNSVFKIDGVVEASGLESFAITVRTQPGRTYSIYYSDADTLTDNTAWIPFANQANGIGTWTETNEVATTFTFIDDFSSQTSGGPIAGDHRFYLVGVDVE
jgi:hypothetical protein